MATIMKEPVSSSVRRAHRPPVDPQRRRDQITAILVVAAFIIAMALTVWLASLFNGVPAELDYPLMMP
jgi:ferric-dicitrate binding protein FerR (iron transport regulator)